MSNRSMVEINHDYSIDAAWLDKMRRYINSGNPACLPDGVTYFGMRHHSEPCPLGEPPRGWDNEKTP